MNYEDTLKKVAQQVKTDEASLQAKADAVLAQEKAGWEAVGKTADEMQILALRISARQVATQRAKLQRSGATLYEGLFVEVPRYKDWAKMAYNKMKNTLTAMPDTEQRLALVSQGAIYIYEDNHDGTYTRHANSSLLNKQVFEEGYDSQEITSLPNRSMQLDANTHFALVWDKNNRQFANGNDNFKYGANRPLEELDRTCLFMGRKQGTNQKPSLISIRLSGNQAKIDFPTFVSGIIPVKESRNAEVCYGTTVTEFIADANVDSIFSSPPVAIANGQPSGFVVDWLGNDFLPSIADTITAYNKLDDKAKWNARYGTVVEVVQIDPRENGGFTISVADTDILSDAPIVDVYVPANQEGEVNFAVGSEMVLIGSPWMTKEGEARFSTNAWWCMNAIAPLADITTGEDDGWDAL